MKRVSEIRDVRIVLAEVLFPGNEGVKGRFIALGVCGVDDRPGFSGSDIRTSPIEKINIEEGVIETMNTLYKIIG